MPTKLTHINLLNTFLYSFWIIIFIIFVVALIEYPGNGFVYVLFSLLANILLYAGFRKNAIFFDTFIGIFFWLGFWLKLTIRVAFLESEFRYPIYRYFDGSGESFDHALIVSSCAFLGLLLSSFIRERFIFVYPFKSDGKGNEGLFGFYTKYRKHIIISFVILFIIVAITNLFLGIYQRGSVPRTILPFGINGIYKWMLLFGLATASAIILRFESRINNQMTYFPIILAFSENFISNVSMFSRGMILNSSALLFGLYKNAKLDSIKIKSYYFIVSLLILFILFGLSFTLVNHVRQIIHGNDSSSYTDFFDETKVAKTLKKYVSGKRRLFIIDRWVGIYGVIAVSSYPEKGWDLWKEAWKENYTDYGTSFYDLNLINSP
ncbi:MAG: hypothetical protein GTO02_04765, partial [Candidatus Dadabacteria bacterium]|nr:hypothetical protein [Candidatus Dadabacteria bacterium]